MISPTQMLDPSRSRRKRLCPWSLLAAASLLVSGCSLHFRTWTDYGYQEISHRTTIERLPTKTYKFTLEHTNGMYWLRFEAHKLCRDVTVRKMREQAKVTLKAPLAPYYLAIGAVLAACSIPFFYMAGKSQTTTRRRNNALTGSFAFLAPGLTLVGFGIYQKLIEGTKTKNIGVLERREPGPPHSCGRSAAAGLPVKVGTKTGVISLGVTDAKGRVLLPHGQLQPLVRREMGKVIKVYFDIMLDNRELGELNVPWPLDRRWLQD